MRWWSVQKIEVLLNRQSTHVHQQFGILRCKGGADSPGFQGRVCAQIDGRRHDAHGRLRGILPPDEIPDAGCRRDHVHALFQIPLDDSIHDGRGQLRSDGNVLFYKENGRF